MPQINAQIVINNGNVQAVVQPTLPFVQIGGFAFSSGGGGGAVSSVTGTTNQITASPTTGAVVLSLPSNVIFPGTWQIGTLNYSDTNILWSAQSSVNSYNQVIVQNTNSNSSASANFIVSNDVGSASGFFGEFGMNSSFFTGSGAWQIPNAVYLDSASSDLSIGTLANKSIHFFTNSSTTDAFTITGTGASIFNGKVQFNQTTTTSPIQIVGFTSDPSVPIEGEISYNTTSHLLKYYNGTSWVSTAATAGWLVTGTTTITGNTTQTGAFTNTFALNGVAITQNAMSSGWQHAFAVTPGTFTVLTATQEFIDYDFGGGTRNITWNDGTVSTQRFAYFRGNTVNKTTTSATFTDIYTAFIDPSIAGTGVTFTRNFALGLGGNLGFTAAASILQTTGNPLTIGTTGGANFIVVTSNITRFQIGATGVTTFTSGITNGGTFINFNHTAATSGINNGLTWIAGAHTNQTLNSEVTDINFNLSAVMKMADGTVATQRAFRIQGRTYTPQTTALTLTEASTLEINAATAGAGTTITTNNAIKITSGQLFLAAGTTTTAPMIVPTGTNLTTTKAGALENDGTHLWFTFTNAGARLQLDNQVAASGWLAAGTTTITANTNQTGSFKNTFNLDQVIVIQNTLSGVGLGGAFVVGIGASTNVTATESVHIAFNLNQIVQFTGSTGFSLQEAFLIQAPTYAFVSATGTITDSATVSITGAPIKGTNAALTNTHALLIRAGAVSTATNSFGATVNAQTGATNNYAAQFIGGLGVQLSHLIGNTSTPGIAAGTGAGTGPTVSVTGTDLGGFISVTTGTAPTLSATVVTITFNVAYGTAPRCVSLTPANALTAALSGLGMVFVDQAGITTTTFAITAGATALTGSVAYKWYYSCIQ